MGYLQLAEKDDSFYSHMAQSKDMYVFVPESENSANGVWVREDYFDDLPDEQYLKVMTALAPFQPTQMNGIFSGIKEKVQNWSANRQERKDAKQQAYIAKQERKASGDTFGSKIANAIQNFTGGGEAQPREMQLPDYQIQVGNEPQPFYKNPAVIVGGLALLGGIIYLATRKK